MVSAAGCRCAAGWSGVLAGLLLCLSISSVGAQGLPGTVTRVVEGDHLVLAGPGGARQEIYMAGIDAPEPGQPYAERSRDGLAEQLTGRFVVVDVLGRGDRGQTLGRVSLGGADMNLDQVVRGLAWAEPATLHLLGPVEQRRYVQAERSARRTGIGLWSEQPAISPWAWRELGVQRPPGWEIGPQGGREE